MESPTEVPATPERSEVWKTLKAEMPEWSDEDISWLEKVPQELKTVAARYERTTFNFVMQHGAVMHALSICMASKPPRNAQIALGILTNSYNNLILMAMKGAGVEEKMFDSCKEDVERVAALMDTNKVQPGDKRSPGGIVLTS